MLLCIRKLLLEICFPHLIFELNSNVSETEFVQQLADNNIEVSPNPFDEQTIVTLTDILSGTYNYSIVDITGKQVLNGSINVSSEKVSMPLSMGDYIAGTYIFRLQYGALTLSKQLQLIR